MLFIQKYKQQPINRMPWIRKCFIGKVAYVKSQFWHLNLIPISLQQQDSFP